MEIHYLQMIFVVIAGIIGIVGVLAYHCIRIYFLIKKNRKNEDGRQVKDRTINY